MTVGGSANSHTAILARTMNIPALVGAPLDLAKIQDNMTAVVDGFEGKVTFNPDARLARAENGQSRNESGCGFWKI